MGYNILIVDDSITVRAMIAKALKLSQLPLGEIYQAGNGQEALEALKANWTDLVLTDINMPVMNGLELVRQMAADELLRTVPVVVVSTEGSQARIDELKSHGIRGYLRKPFTPEVLKAEVENILGANDG
jgi:two-component system, chemotaxis family, chemotaxis protein CheY